MICNAFGTSGISPATEEIVANIMAKAVRNEGHRAALPLVQSENQGWTGPTLCHLRVMNAILDNPWITQRQIAEMLDCTTGMVASRLSKLRALSIQIEARRKLHNGTSWQTHYRIKRGRA